MVRNAQQELKNSVTPHFAEASRASQKIMKIYELKNKTSIIIKPKVPYNFDATVFKPSHYPDPLKIYETGKYWFGLELNGQVYGLKMTNRGSVEKPKIEITIFANHILNNKERKEIIDELDYRFEFSKYLSEFYKKLVKDKVLAPFLKRWRGMHNSCAQDLYGLLMIGIFLQNTVIKRTVQMTKVMLEKYGKKLKFAGKEVFIFWQPKDLIKVSEDELRKLKIGYRAKLFIKLSETFVKEKIDELELRKLSKEKIKEKLLKLYGIGPETARILLTEAFHFDGYFEHVAPWQQKIYSRLLYHKPLVPTQKIIQDVNKRWGKWAQLAANYVWEDIFWQRKQGKKIEWLEKEIRE